MSQIQIIALYLLACLLLGILGRKRKLGGWGYFFGSIVLTPAIGLILVMASDPKKVMSHFKKILILWVFWSSVVGARPLTIVCGTPGLETQICQKAVNRWSEKNQVKVNVLIAPNNPDQLFALYLTAFKNELSLADVILIEDRWLGVLRQYLLPLGDSSQLFNATFVPTAIDQFTWDDQLLALPWGLDAVVLYSRGEQPPSNRNIITINQLDFFQQAVRVQNSQALLSNTLSQDSVWVWAGELGNQFMLNMLQWIAASSDQTLPITNDSIDFSSYELLQIIKEQINVTIPEMVFAFNKAQAYSLYAQGKAIFFQGMASDWLELSQTLPGQKTNFTLPPYLKYPRTIITTQGLAITRASPYPQQAQALIKFLTDTDEQRNRLYAGNFFPTKIDLYANKKLQEEFPMLKLLGQAIPYMVGGLGKLIQNDYHDTNKQLQQIMQDMLMGIVTMDESIKKINKLLKKNQ